MIKISQHNPITDDPQLSTDKYGWGNIKLPIPNVIKNITNSTGASCLIFKEYGCTDRVLVFHKPYRKNCFKSSVKEFRTK